MDKKKLKTIMKVIAGVFIGAVVLLMVIVPFLLDGNNNINEHKASILSAELKTETVSKTISGAGTIADAEPVEVTVPDGVEVIEYLVEEGDYVTEGTPLARVNKTSVMQTIATIQENLDYVAEEMADIESDNSTTATVTATIGGKAIYVYAAEGDKVSEVMARYGCLAVFSADGNLALKIQLKGELNAGEKCYVILEDGTRITGKVESAFNGAATVTFSDKYGWPGQNATVTTLAEEEVGSGEIYIHSEWRALAYSGTIKTVSVAPGKSFANGGTLFKLEDTDTGAEYNTLAAEHREYEELMAELFRLYQDGTVNASCDGCVGDIDDSLVEEVSYSSKSGVSGDNLLAAVKRLFSIDRSSGILSLFAPQTGEQQGEQPEKTEETGITVTLQYYCITSTAVSTMAVSSPFTVTVDSYTELNSMYSTGSCTITAGYSFMGGSLGCYTLEDIKEKVKDEDSGKTESKEIITGYNPVCSGNVTDGDAGVIFYDVDKGAFYFIKAAGGQSINTNTGGSSGGFSMGSFYQTEEYEQYEPNPVTVMTVTAQDSVTVSITVDELDILSVSKGQAVSVTVDAFPGRSFDGTVTSVDAAGSNSGGNTKFTAEVTLKRENNMLEGMNASCTITVSSVENVLTLPSEAIVDQGTRSIVYTGYDEKEECLINPVEVELGVSDGINTQILSGLSSGEAVWYAYYDTLSIADQIAEMMNRPK